jgi:hypothetical protein
MTTLKKLARRAGPYLALELILPGGSILALALWLSQHWHKES